MVKLFSVSSRVGLPCGISSKDKLNLWINKRSSLSIDFDIHTGVCEYEMIFEDLGEKIKIEHLIKFL